MQNDISLKLLYILLKKLKTKLEMSLKAPYDEMSLRVRYAFLSYASLRSLENIQVIQFYKFKLLEEKLI